MWFIWSGTVTPEAAQIRLILTQFGGLEVQSWRNRVSHTRYNKHTNKYIMPLNISLDVSWSLPSTRRNWPIHTTPPSPTFPLWVPNLYVNSNPKRWMKVPVLGYQRYVLNRSLQLQHQFLSRSLISTERNSTDDGGTSVSGVLFKVLLS